MKKLLSILIAMIFLMSISLAAAAEGSTPPAPPEGGMGGTPPDMPEGGMGGTPPGMPGGGSSSADLTYTAAVEITASET